MNFFTFTLNLERNHPVPLVDQIEHAIVQAIEQHKLRAGMPLPSIRKLARMLGISTFTVANAYSRLVSLGWIDARAGSGYKVAIPERARLVTNVQQWSPPEPGASWLLSDVFADHSIPIKAGCGWTPNEWMSELHIARSLRNISRVTTKQLTSYGNPLGYVPLRELIAQGLLHHGLALDITQICLTRGATEAIDLVTRTLLQPGDTVIVEAPCYANLLPMLQLARLHVVSIDRTPQGIDTDKLAQLVRQHTPSAIYLNPVLHNPTGSTLPASNIDQIMQIASQHGLWVFEDDISRELALEESPLLAASEGLERVVYIGGYSKSISPSLRVGYVAAHRNVITRLVRTKMAVGLTSPEIMERVAFQILSDTRYPTYLGGLRERLRDAHAQVVARMEERNFEIFCRPGAGLFLWARPSAPSPANEELLNANRLTELALKEGIWLAPGSYFHVDGTSTAWLRFNVGYSEKTELWQFLDHALSLNPARR